MKTNVSAVLMVLFFCSFFYSTSNAQELLPLLQQKFGAENVAVNDSSAFKEYYSIKFRQPIDHRDTSRGFFMQKILLGHENFNQPMVIETNGYEILPYQTFNYKSEPAKVLNANQVIVEHRYYGKSVPDSTNKTWLNFEQASSDYHAVKTSFSDLYKKQWVSTGASKGGLAAMNYRFYYPKDTDASFVYVAPVLKNTEDERITSFLNQKRLTPTGKKIYEIQQYLLDHKFELTPVFLELLKFSGLEIGTMDPETLYDFAVLEFDFNFWQYIPDFDKLLSQNKRALEGMEKKGFKNNGRLVSQNDSMVAIFPMCTWFFLLKEVSSPFFYQCFTQMGSYGYEEQLFKGLKHKNYSLAFLAGQHPKFSKRYSRSFNRFLKNKIDRTIFIYGADDPWTACRVNYSAHQDNILIINPASNHSTQLEDARPDEKVIARDRLKKWLDLDSVNLN